ncbi:hypothetical protein [Amycolatopsis sp. NPDC003731]
MLETILVAIGSALGSGGAIKGIELWLKRNRDKIDDRKVITDEWRADWDKRDEIHAKDIQDLRARLDLVEKKLEMKNAENEELKAQLAEKDFQLRERELAFKEYKTHVYVKLVELGADKELIEEIRKL